MQLKIYDEPTEVTNFSKTTTKDPVTGNKITVWFGEFRNGDFSLNLDHSTNLLSGYITRFGELSKLDADTAIEIYQQLDK